jgi:hypothetical protein
MGISTSEKTTELFKAIQQVQQECGIIGKDASNPHFKSEYVSLEKQWTVVKPLLDKAGLVLIQPPGFIADGKLSIDTIIHHVPSGQFIISTGQMPIGKEGPQAVGSAITYARRYFMQACLSVVAGDEDDDGETAEGRKESVKALNTLRERKETLFSKVKSQGEKDLAAWAGNILKRKVDANLTLKNESELQVLEAAVILLGK